MAALSYVNNIGYHNVSPPGTYTFGESYIEERFFEPRTGKEAYLLLDEARRHSINFRLSRYHWIALFNAVAKGASANNYPTPFDEWDIPYQDPLAQLCKEIERRRLAAFQASLDFAMDDMFASDESPHTHPYSSLSSSPSTPTTPHGLSPLRQASLPLDRSVSAEVQQTPATPPFGGEVYTKYSPHVPGLDLLADAAADEPMDVDEDYADVSFMPGNDTLDNAGMPGDETLGNIIDHLDNGTLRQISMVNRLQGRANTEAPTSTAQVEKLDTNNRRSFQDTRTIFMVNGSTLPAITVTVPTPDRPPATSANATMHGPQDDSFELPSSVANDLFNQEIELEDLSDESIDSEEMDLDDVALRLIPTTDFGSTVEHEAESDGEFDGDHSFSPSNSLVRITAASLAQTSCPTPPQRVYNPTLGIFETPPSSPATSPFVNGSLDPTAPAVWANKPIFHIGLASSPSPAEERRRHFMRQQPRARISSAEQMPPPPPPVTPPPPINFAETPVRNRHNPNKATPSPPKPLDEGKRDREEDSSPETAPRPIKRRRIPESPLSGRGNGMASQHHAGFFAGPAVGQAGSSQWPGGLHPDQYDLPSIPETPPSPPLETPSGVSIRDTSRRGQVEDLEFTPTATSTPTRAYDSANPPWASSTVAAFGIDASRALRRHDTTFTDDGQVFWPSEYIPRDSDGFAVVDSYDSALMSSPEDSDEMLIDASLSMTNTDDVQTVPLAAWGTPAPMPAQACLAMVGAPPLSPIAEASEPPSPAPTSTATSTGSYRLPNTGGQPRSPPTSLRTPPARRALSRPKNDFLRAVLETQHQRAMVTNMLGLGGSSRAINGTIAPPATNSETISIPVVSPLTEAELIELGLIPSPAVEPQDVPPPEPRQRAAIPTNPDEIHAALAVESPSAPATAAEPKESATSAMVVTSATPPHEEAETVVEPAPMAETVVTLPGNEVAEDPAANVTIMTQNLASSVPTTATETLDTAKEPAVQDAVTYMVSRSTEAIEEATELTETEVSAIPGALPTSESPPTESPPTEDLPTEDPPVRLRKRSRTQETMDELVARSSTSTVGATEPYPAQATADAGISATRRKRQRTEVAPLLPPPAPAKRQSQRQRQRQVSPSASIAEPQPHQPEPEAESPIADDNIDVNAENTPSTIAPDTHVSAHSESRTGIRLTSPEASPSTSPCTSAATAAPSPSTSTTAAAPAASPPPPTAAVPAASHPTAASGTRRSTRFPTTNPPIPTRRSTRSSRAAVPVAEPSTNTATPTTVAAAAATGADGPLAKQTQAVTRKPRAFARDEEQPDAQIEATADPTPAPAPKRVRRAPAKTEAPKPKPPTPKRTRRTAAAVPVAEPTPPPIDTPATPADIPSAPLPAAIPAAVAAPPPPPIAPAAAPVAATGRPIHTRVPSVRARAAAEAAAQAVPAEVTAVTTAAKKAWPKKATKSAATIKAEEKKKEKVEKVKEKKAAPKKKAEPKKAEPKKAVAPKETAVPSQDHVLARRTRSRSRP